MLFDKIGLAGGKLDINPEIPTRGFKTYEYSELDYKRVYTPYDVMRLQINIPFKILNGILTIKGEEYNLGNKVLKDVHDIFNKYGAASFFTGYEKFANLPAILLCNCSNVFTTNTDGHISPQLLKSEEKNQSITTKTEVISNVLVYDTATYKGKAFNQKEGKIYYEPSMSTKIYLTTMAKDLYLRIDFGPRRLISEKDVSYLLNFKKD